MRGTTALMEAKFTMEPRPLSTMPREKTLVGRTVPKKFSRKAIGWDDQGQLTLPWRDAGEWFDAGGLRGNPS